MFFCFIFRVLPRYFHFSYLVDGQAKQIVCQLSPRFCFSGSLRLLDQNVTFPLLALCLFSVWRWCHCHFYVPNKIQHDNETKKQQGVVRAPKAGGGQDSTEGGGMQEVAGKIYFYILTSKWDTPLPPSPPPVPLPDNVYLYMYVLSVCVTGICSRCSIGSRYRLNLWGYNVNITRWETGSFRTRQT